ncbi:MAG: hypothetical protein II886_10720 [Prevotella sp.]|nr:hypothetical protein [Prevotella sp.]
MKRKMFLMAAAAITLLMTMAVLTACTSDNDDNPAGGGMVGKWCGDVSGKTYAKWNYGETWQVTELKADGTGTTDIYYTNKDKPIAREHRDFTYVAAEAAVLTEGLQKADATMAAKFDTWSQTEELIPVPQPAKFTVFVYGNAGGTMDIAIEEGFWEEAKKFLTDHDNVRVVCFYKYGKDLPQAPFSGKYANPGDIVWFELTSETDINKIKEEGFQAMGFGDQAIRLKLCDPDALKMFIEFSSLVCPAEQYVFSIWGHGSGFSPMTDVPGKYDVSGSATRGVIADEWNDREQLNMYELHDAIHASDIDRLNTLFFHNCMMGNLETLTEVKDCADYICCSSHILRSNGEVLTEFVRGLVDKGNAEDAMAQMFERNTPVWQNEYRDDGEIANGDYKMYRTDKFDAILDAAKHLADRLITLYPTQKDAIDRATSKVYRFIPMEGMEFQEPFFDIADYAHLLAQETDDAQMKTIAAEMDNAFKEAFVHYRDVSWSQQHLDHYTLSVCLAHQLYYTYDFKSANSTLFPNNFDEGYELSGFHKHTGWGNWLRMNEQSLGHNPQCGGGGALE